MTPAEEQILRNQAVILEMLTRVLTIDLPTFDALGRGTQRLKETHELLNIKCAQGRTVHAYTP